jgi:hypothetical protein
MPRRGACCEGCRRTNFHPRRETALQHGEWKAATVLAGSVVEALLLWATSQRGSTAFEECFRKSFPSEKRIDPKHPQEWHLHHLIDVAKSLKIVGDRTAEAATLAKDFRNLHSSRPDRKVEYARQPSDRSFGCGSYSSCARGPQYIGSRCL